MTTFAHNNATRESFRQSRIEAERKEAAVRAYIAAKVPQKAPTR